MREVVVVQELLAHYRLPFYELLRLRLDESGIRLRLMHGDPPRGRRERQDQAELGWAEKVPTRHLTVGGRAFVWQSVLARSRDADLVVVEHANRQLINYALLGRARLGGPAVAFWGHGANLQTTSPRGVAERLKGQTARLPRWWFAYTEGSAARVQRTGFPRERITVVNNTIDTSDYPSEADKIPGACVFVGSLHSGKNLDLLIEASDLLADRVAGFQLAVVGAGEMTSSLVEAAARRPWLTYKGALFGRDKAALVSQSELMLMPGLVGLAIVDSFAGRAPLITTTYPFHSPEIEYLENGVNGYMVEGPPSAQSFAGLVATVLEDRERLTRLQRGCENSRARLSIEDMAGRFAEGIVSAVR